MSAEKLTYAMYAANPAIRDAIDLEVKRVRAEVMSRYLITPLASLFARIFRRARETGCHQPRRTRWIQQF